MHLEVGQKIELDYLIPEYNEEVYYATIVEIKGEEVTLERSGVAFDKSFLN